MVVDMVLKWCRLYMLEENDLYRKVVMEAHSSPGNSWSKKSLAIMRAWGILDWPEWNQNGGTKACYKVSSKRPLSPQLEEGSLTASATHPISGC